MFDSVDLQILNILQGDARAPQAEIARQVGMAPSGILQRLRKLEDRGVIRGSVLRLDPDAVERGLLAFVYLRTAERLGEATAAEALVAMPDVLEVHDIAGEDCYLIKVRARDTNDLHKLLRERIAAVPTVVSTSSVIVLKTFKESVALSLDHLAPIDGVVGSGAPGSGAPGNGAPGNGAPSPSRTKNS